MIPRSSLIQLPLSDWSAGSSAAACKDRWANSAETEGRDRWGPGVRGAIVRHCGQAARQHAAVGLPARRAEPRYVGAENVEEDGTPFPERFAALPATLEDQFAESARQRLGSPNLSLTPGDLIVPLKDVTQAADLQGAAVRVPAEVRAGRLTQDTVKLVFAGTATMHPTMSIGCCGHPRPDSTVGALPPERIVELRSSTRVNAPASVNNPLPDRGECMPPALDGR